MINYENESRLQLALEHAERLADDMRRSRRPTADAAGYPVRARLDRLLHRLGHLGRHDGAEPTLAPHDA
jgi:hypothetical protein